MAKPEKKSKPARGGYYDGKMRDRIANPPAFTPEFTEATFPENEAVSNEVEAGAFRARLHINKHDLNREVSEQPANFGDCCDRVAHARSLRDAAKDHLKTTEAEVYLSRRAKLDAAGEKYSEKLLDAYVQISKRRRAAFRKLTLAEREVAEWEGLRDSFRDRGFMLRELCAMQLSSFFAEGSVKSSDITRKEINAARARSDLAARRKAGR